MRETKKGIYFFGGILSNFHPCNIKYFTKNFTSSEQKFMYDKAMYFNDQDIAEKILNCKTPKEAKKLGRQVKNFNADKWSEVSFNIMYDAVLSKFSQNPELKEYLLNTGDKIIVEASPYDTIWGIGKHFNDPDIDDESTWKGKNLLGEVLMLVRFDLQVTNIIKNNKR